MLGSAKPPNLLVACELRYFVCRKLPKPWECRAHSKDEEGRTLGRHARYAFLRLVCVRPRTYFASDRPRSLGPLDAAIRVLRPTHGESIPIKPPHHYLLFRVVCGFLCFLLNFVCGF